MADLILSEESRQYQELARDFSQGEIAPLAHEYDRTGEFPSKVLDKAWQIGLVNVALPEDLGGLGLTVSDACVIAEEISAGCAGVGAAFWGNDLALAPLMVAENVSDLKDNFVSPLFKNCQLASYSFVFENDNNSLTYSQTGGGFVLTGNCLSINAGTAPWLVALASSGAQSTVFVIPIQSKGVTVGAHHSAFGLRAADIRGVKFDQVEVTANHVVGTVGAGLALWRHAEANVAPILAAHAIGIARSALENAISYSKERYTFGVPIAKHQAVGLMLADMAKNIEAARYMPRKVAWRADHGQQRVEQAMMSRSFAFEAAMKSAEDAVQIYGGYGYSREYPVEKLMRDAKAMQIYQYAGLSDRVALGKQLVAAAQ